MKIHPIYSGSIIYFLSIVPEDIHRKSTPIPSPSPNRGKGDSGFQELSINFISYRCSFFQQGKKGSVYISIQTTTEPWFAIVYFFHLLIILVRYL